MIGWTYSPIARTFPSNIDYKNLSSCGPTAKTIKSNSLLVEKEIVRAELAGAVPRNILDRLVWGLQYTSATKTLMYGR